MKDKEFNILLEDLDNESKYFHEDTCSATYNKQSIPLHGIITFRDSDEETRMDLNIGDAAYIFDSFLDIDEDKNKVIEFFNKFIEYRGLKIINFKQL